MVARHVYYTKVKDCLKQFYTTPSGGWTQTREEVARWRDRRKRGGRRRRREEQRCFFVLYSLPLTPLGFSWTIITHCAPVDPHLQFASECVPVQCVCVCTHMHVCESVRLCVSLQLCVAVYPIPAFLNRCLWMCPTYVRVCVCVRERERERKHAG